MSVKKWALARRDVTKQYAMNFLETANHEVCFISLSSLPSIKASELEIQRLTRVDDHMVQILWETRINGMWEMAKEFPRGWGGEEAGGAGLVCSRRSAELNGKCWQDKDGGKTDGMGGGSSKRYVLIGADTAPFLTFQAARTCPLCLVPGKRKKDIVVPVNMHVNWCVCFEPSWLLLCLQQCDTQFFSYRWFLVNTRQDFNSEAMSKGVISSNHCLLVDNGMDPGFSVMSDSGFSFLSSHGQTWLLHGLQILRTCTGSLVSPSYSFSLWFLMTWLDLAICEPAWVFLSMCSGWKLSWKSFVGAMASSFVWQLVTVEKLKAHPTSSSMLYFSSVY